MSRQLSPVAETLILTDGAGHLQPYAGGFPDYGHMSKAGEIVRRWHNDVHLGAFSTCTEEPCDAVRRVE